MYCMFLLGTLGLGFLYFVSSMLFVMAIGQLYGSTAALWTGGGCAVIAVFAGTLIGALLAGNLKHPLQAQLEEIVAAASTHRDPDRDFRYSSRSSSPYAREQDAPSYGDAPVPVASDPGAHRHDAPWRPSAVAPPEPTPVYAPPAPSSGYTTSGIPSASQGRAAIRRAKAALQDRVPVEQLQQRMQAGDVEGAIALGQQAIERELGATSLDEVYAALPSLLASYRSGGGRATLGELAQRTRQAAASSTGQTRQDAETLTSFLERLQTLSPADVPLSTWAKILGSVGQARKNPRAFFLTVAEALQVDKTRPG